MSKRIKLLVDRPKPKYEGLAKGLFDFGDEPVTTWALTKAQHRGVLLCEIVDDGNTEAPPEIKPKTVVKSNLKVIPKTKDVPKSMPTEEVEMKEHGFEARHVLNPSEGIPPFSGLDDRAIQTIMGNGITSEDELIDKLKRPTEFKQTVVGVDHKMLSVLLAWAKKKEAK